MLQVYSIDFEISLCDDSKIIWFACKQDDI